jgi:hypothetical protein
MRLELRLHEFVEFAALEAADSFETSDVEPVHAVAQLPEGSVRGGLTLSRGITRHWSFTTAAT